MPRAISLLVAAVLAAAAAAEAGAGFAAIAADGLARAADAAKGAAGAVGAGVGAIGGAIGGAAGRAGEAVAAAGGAVGDAVGGAVHRAADAAAAAGGAVGAAAGKAGEAVAAAGGVIGGAVGRAGEAAADAAAAGANKIGEAAAFARGAVGGALGAAADSVATASLGLLQLVLARLRPLSGPIIATLGSYALVSAAVSATFALWAFALEGPLAARGSAPAKWRVAAPALWQLLVVLALCGALWLDASSAGDAAGADSALRNGAVLALAFGLFPTAAAAIRLGLGLGLGGGGGGGGELAAQVRLAAAAAVGAGAWVVLLLELAFPLVRLADAATLRAGSPGDAATEIIGSGVAVLGASTGAWDRFICPALGAIGGAAGAAAAGPPGMAAGAAVGGFCSAGASTLSATVPDWVRTALQALVVAAVLFLKAHVFLLRSLKGLALLGGLRGPAGLVVYAWLDVLPWARKRLSEQLSVLVVGDGGGAATEAQANEAVVRARAIEMLRGLVEEALAAQGARVAQAAAAAPAAGAAGGGAGAAPVPS